MKQSRALNKAARDSSRHRKSSAANRANRPLRVHTQPEEEDANTKRSDSADAINQQKTTHIRQTQRTTSVSIPLSQQSTSAATATVASSNTLHSSTPSPNGNNSHSTPATLPTLVEVTPNTFDTSSVEALLSVKNIPLSAQSELPTVASGKNDSDSGEAAENLTVPDDKERSSSIPRSLSQSALQTVNKTTALPPKAQSHSQQSSMHTPAHTQSPPSSSPSVAGIAASQSSSSSSSSIIGNSAKVIRNVAFELNPAINVQDDRSGWSVKKLLDFWHVKGLSDEHIAAATHENLTIPLDSILMFGAKLSRAIDKAFDS